MTTQPMKLVKIDALHGQHDTGDTRAATRYAVYVGDVKIGEIGSHSVQSWAHDRSGRIRTRMLGYRRTWIGVLETTAYKTRSLRGSDASHSARVRCAEQLVQAWQERNR